MKALVEGYQVQMVMVRGGGDPGIGDGVAGEATLRAQVPRPARSCGRIRARRGVSAGVGHGIEFGERGDADLGLELTLDGLGAVLPVEGFLLCLELGLQALAAQVFDAATQGAHLVLDVEYLIDQELEAAKIGRSCKQAPRNLFFVTDWSARL